MELGLTQNVVIMEAELTMVLRERYLRATRQFGWSKTELTARIAVEAHLEIILEIDEELCDNSSNEEYASGSGRNAVTYSIRQFMQLIQLQRCRGDLSGEEYNGTLCGYRYSRRSGLHLCDVREDQVLC